MINYDEMSNFEIGLAILKIECAGQVIVYHEQEHNELLDLIDLPTGLDRVKYTTPMGRVCTFDINSPSDMWPIIIENKIGITHGSSMCSAVAVIEARVIQIACTTDEILRAAAICFLKMMEAK